MQGTKGNNIVTENPLNIHETNRNKFVTPVQKKIYEINVNNQQKVVESPSTKLTDICFNNIKHKTQLATIDVSGSLKIWDVAKGPHGKIIQTFQASKIWLTSVDVEQQEGRKVACGTLDGKLLIFEINIGIKKGKTFSKDKANIEMTGHTGAIQCVQFLSPQYIIAGSTDSLVSLWDLDSSQRYLALHQQHTGDVLCLDAFQGDSNIFLSGSSDLTCKIWDIRVKKSVQAEFKDHESAVNTVKFLPFGHASTFVTGSDDATINLWDLRKRDPVAKFQDDQHYDSIYSLAVSSSGRYVFAATENFALKVFDMLGGCSPVEHLDVGLLQNDGLIKCVDISADGYALGMALGSKGNHKDLTIIM